MQTSGHCHFTPEENGVRTHWTGGWVDTRTGLEVTPSGIRAPDCPTPGLVCIPTLFLLHSVQVFPHKMATSHVVTKSNITYRNLHGGYTVYYSYRFVPFLVYSPTSSSS